MYDFEFIRAKTVEEAVAALAADDEAMALSGGQTLLPTMKQRLASPTKLVSLANIPALQGVALDDEGRLAVKAATPHAVVAREAAAPYPALAALAGQIGDPAVRSRGTIGGSLANNDPSACYPAAALGSNALIRTNARDIDADAYFQGMFATVLEPGEIVIEVVFPIPEAAAYIKFPQPASRFALVGVFVARFFDGVRVAVTGASDGGVYRWSEAEEALGAEFAPAALDALEVHEDGMIGDIHGSAAYRAHLVRVMARRAVSAAAA
jgi:aerobic carbon-monoxide dehydrogenase medium subunit